MLVPRAQLKVFSPLDAFPTSERARWRTYVEEGRGLTRREAATTEATDARARLLTGQPRARTDGALVRRAGQRVMICPLDLELRAAVAFAAFRHTVPQVVADAFVVDEQEATRLRRLASMGRMPHILDEPWAVPLDWFVAFSPDERRFTDPPEGTGPRLSYLTTCEQATDRLTQAIGVVEAAVEDGEDVLVALASVAAWLDSFDGSSLLQLDYGPVAKLFAPAELEADRTCDELWQAIRALATGDLLEAAAAYGVARSRWTQRRAKQHTS